MKIAISGKGGVGKTLLAALLAKVFADFGYSVFAIDADPDSNLAAAIGFPHSETVTPISEMSGLIAERTGMKPGQSGALFRLNPKVDDLPEKYSLEYDGIKLMVMGRVKQGGTGCYCPEGALLKALVANLVLARSEVVIMDMEAGVEHLGRGTAQSVDKLIIVVEPGRRSIETAYRINKLAADIGLSKIAIVGNKIRSQSDKEFIISNLPDFQFLGFIPYDEAILETDHANLPIFDASHRVTAEVKNIYQALMSTKSSGAVSGKESKAG